MVIGWEQLASDWLAAPGGRSSLFPVELGVLVLDCCVSGFNGSSFYNETTVSVVYSLIFSLWRALGAC